ncbi:MAG: hypothetical protein AAF585_09110 [Verrucomicrobiota bacterium]
MTDSSDPNNIYAPPQSQAAPAAADPNLPPPSTNLRPLCIVMGVLICLGSLGCLCFGGFYGGMILSIKNVAENMLQIDEPAVLDIIDQLSPVASKIGLSIIFICCIALTGGGIWLGIGSMMCRRWAQKLLLATGWAWAVFQLIGFISMLVMIPAILKFNEAMVGIAGPPGSGSVGMSGLADIIQQVISQFAGLVPPIILIIVYSLKNVKLTFSHLDQKSRWTDDIPIPALAVWIAFMWGLLFFVGTTPLSYDFGYAFGVILTGPSALGFFVLQLVICILAAFLIAKRNIVGWIIALISLPAFYINGALAMKNWDTLEFIRAIGVPSNLVDELVNTAPAEIWPAFDELMFAQWMVLVIIAVAILVFLIVYRRSFVREA